MITLRLTDSDMETIQNALHDTARDCDQAAGLERDSALRHELERSAQEYRTLAEKLGDAERVIYEG